MLETWPYGCCSIVKCWDIEEVGPWKEVLFLRICPCRGYWHSSPFSSSLCFVSTMKWPSSFTTCSSHEALPATGQPATTHKLQSLKLWAQTWLFFLRGEYFINSVKNGKLTNIPNFKLAISFTLLFLLKKIKSSSVHWWAQHSHP